MPDSTWSTPIATPRCSLHGHCVRVAIPNGHAIRNGMHPTRSERIHSSVPKLRSSANPSNQISDILHRYKMCNFHSKSSRICAKIEPNVGRWSSWERPSLGCLDQWSGVFLLPAGQFGTSSAVYTSGPWETCELAILFSQRPIKTLFGLSRRPLLFTHLLGE